MGTKTVIGVAGMPGAGKSVVSRTAQRMGFAVVVMGDIVREETKKRSLSLTPENVGTIMLKLREEHGPAVVAQLCVPKIESVRNSVVVIDGLRSLHEVEEFKRHFRRFVLIGIHASPETRFKRLFRRQRSDDPQGWETFNRRDLRELSVGLGSVIAVVDYLIFNEGPIAQTENQIRIILGEITKNE